MNGLPSPLLVVTDRTLCPVPLDQQVEKLFAAGARWLWFRDKDLEFEQRKALALQLAEIVERHGGTFSVGGDVALAQSIAARAAHVSTPDDVIAARQALEDDALIGMSAHGVPDVAVAKIAGADYVTLSPIYQTTSKPGYGPALGVAAISAAREHDIPVVALGGITVSNLRELKDAGASAVAMMGQCMRTRNPDEFVQSVMHCWHQKHTRNA